MISSTSVRNKMLSLLDAEAGDYYGDTEDIIPAINMAKGWLISAINAGLGQRKFGEEIFSEIHQAKVVATSQFSRFHLGLLSERVWTITAITVGPTLTGTPALGTSNVNQGSSVSGVAILEVGKPAKRLTLEQWNENRDNPMAAGYDGDQICDALKEYAYLNPIQYIGAPSPVQEPYEIQIRPALNRGYLGVYFVEEPADITALGTADLAFPSKTEEILTQKALQYIAFQQGDQTNLYQVSAADLNQLATALL